MIWKLKKNTWCLELFESNVNLLNIIQTNEKTCCRRLIDFSFNQTDFDLSEEETCHATIRMFVEFNLLQLFNISYDVSAKLNYGLRFFPLFHSTHIHYTLYRPQRPQHDKHNNPTTYTMSSWFNCFLDVPLWTNCSQLPTVPTNREINWPLLNCCSCIESNSIFSLLLFCVVAGPLSVDFKREEELSACKISQLATCAECLSNNVCNGNLNLKCW